MAIFLGNSDLDNPRLHYFSRFSSITLNNCEAHFLQLKLELYGLYCTLHALRLHLIGLHHLVVEVDAKYIKGMLSNPDIAPSASINWWIVSILMFYFDLVHVPGAFHGPDGLSRRCRQPDDSSEPEDNFDDWIDQVHGFLHILLPLSKAPIEQPPVSLYIVSTFVAKESDDESDPDNQHDAPLCYDDIPWSELACKADKHTALVCTWHDTLVCPNSLSDTEYETFLWYCTEFFIASDKLWCKNYKGEHKLVISASSSWSSNTMKQDIMAISLPRNLSRFTIGGLI